MAKTISTHNGRQAHRAHNIRDPKAVSGQEHIKPGLAHLNETLIDIEPRKAYKQIFGSALTEYNAKIRPERRIEDYYNHIRADKKKAPVYEMIIQVGDRNDTGITATTERQIIKDFIADWSRRNPNLFLIGAYIHADEADGTVHAHLDYIPVASGYKRGMSLQNGLERALNQQGFATVGINRTAQISWEKRENETLERICNSYGIEISHPRTGDKHKDTPEYKKKQQLIEEINNLAEIRAVTAQKLHETETMINDLERQKSELEGTVEGLRRKADDIISEHMDLGYEVQELKKELTDLIEKHNRIYLEISKLNHTAAKTVARNTKLSDTEHELKNKITSFQSDLQALEKKAEDFKMVSGLAKDLKPKFEKHMGKIDEYLKNPISIALHAEEIRENIESMEKILDTAIKQQREAENHAVHVRDINRRHSEVIPQLQERAARAEKALTDKSVKLSDAERKLNRRREIINHNPELAQHYMAVKNELEMQEQAEREQLRQERDRYDRGQSR